MKNLALDGILSTSQRMGALEESFRVIFCQFLQTLISFSAFASCLEPENHSFWSSAHECLENILKTDIFAIIGIKERESRHLWKIDLKYAEL